MSFIVRMANYRSWLPLILLFAGLTFFHVHLENYYSSVISNDNGTVPLRQPRPFYDESGGGQSKKEAATAKEEPEGIRNGEPYVEGKPWLSKRHLMKYPEKA